MRGLEAGPGEGRRVAARVAQEGALEGRPVAVVSVREVLVALRDQLLPGEGESDAGRALCDLAQALSISGGTGGRTLTLKAERVQ